MRDVALRLSQVLRSGNSVAYCRLVETRGSTPQKAGAMMLVFPDGSQAGTLGGGCVEAEVKRRALAVLQAQRAEVARFQLDSDYGWDDGLICGGRMVILITPLGSGIGGSGIGGSGIGGSDIGGSDIGGSDIGGSDIGGSDIGDGYFPLWADLISSGTGLTEAVVFESEASGVPSPSVFLFDHQDRPLIGLNLTGQGELSLAPDEVPPIVLEHLRPLAERPRPYAVRGISYLPTLSRCRLVIVGGGHVGQAVGDLASKLEFDVWVVDDRAEFVTEQRFPTAERRIAGTVAEVLPALEITPNTYCLIVTRGHNHDEEALFHLVNRGARYVGLIGSRRKIRMIFDDLLAAGISPPALEQVFAPLGIDIGSQTVPEIAVSICAELVSHRNRNGVVPGRPESIPAVHDEMHT